MSRFSKEEEESFSNLIKLAIAPLQEEIKELRQELRKDTQELRVAIHELKRGLDQVAVRQRNSTLGREERLEKVPNRLGFLPSDDIYPETIMHLVVAGNEKLPNNSTNNWNKTKGKNLLLFYEEDDDQSDGEQDEYSETSRARRLKVARAIGVTRQQLNFCQLTL